MNKETSKRDKEFGPSLCTNQKYAQRVLVSQKKLESMYDGDQNCEIMMPTGLLAFMVDKSTSFFRLS